MALQEFVGGTVFPLIPSSMSGTPSFTTSAFLIDAADESVAAIVQVPRTGTITKVGFGTRTVTTGATLDIRLETLSGKNPSGTLWGTNTNGSQVVTTGVTWHLTTLTAGASVTQGDLIAVVIKNPTASFGTMQIAAFQDDPAFEVPYALLNTGVSPAVSWATVSGSLNISFEYSDAPTNPPIPGTLPMRGSVSTNTFSTSNAGYDAMGLRFQMPFPCRILGSVIWMDLDGNGKVMLVDTSYHQANATGILASITLTETQEGSSTGAPHIYYFPAPYTIAANTNYRLIVEPTTTTNLSLYDFDFDSLALMDAVPGGANWHLTLAKDPTGDGSWTNYTSGQFRRPFIYLIIDKFDDGVSTGGASAHTF